MREKQFFFSSFDSITISLISFHFLSSYHSKKDHALNLTESAELMGSLGTKTRRFCPHGRQITEEKLAEALHLPERFCCSQRQKRERPNRRALKDG